MHTRSSFWSPKGGRSHSHVARPIRVREDHDTDIRDNQMRRAQSVLSRKACGNGASCQATGDRNGIEDSLPSMEPVPVDVVVRPPAIPQEEQQWESDAEPCFGYWEYLCQSYFYSFCFGTERWPKRTLLRPSFNPQDQFPINGKSESAINATPQPGCCLA